MNRMLSFYYDDIRRSLLGNKKDMEKITGDTRSGDEKKKGGYKANGYYITALRNAHDNGFNLDERLIDFLASAMPVPAPAEPAGR